ncbi:Microtubule-associated protein Asp [Plasmopara halstedii]|uniref:Microtubule-associated protein Asp n=1 Tax=Plasmopara halstedii TaxID=4781 RepID=A0A0P1B3E2_PLAHL|nr:Microtubule-associated protein Asp [Plasmopara halstedii]CEG49272.1 Microtubule-associated protein Asp [Plasmopara halstedii]|eukprot:XP_024585641.1 Microtubule-associated protein Asp [Plasmopara halstedii]
MVGDRDAIQDNYNSVSCTSFDTLDALTSDAIVQQNSHEIAVSLSDKNSDGKENRVPLIGDNWGHPNITMRRRSRKSADLHAFTSNSEPPVSSSILGKRLASNTSLGTFNESEESDFDADRAHRVSLESSKATTHFEARASALHTELLDIGPKTGGSIFASLRVDDYNHIPELHFGSVAVGDRRSRQLIIENTKEIGNARVKYDGHVLISRSSELLQSKTRFKCDLHVCVVGALKSVTLRVTFEPFSSDVGRQVMAMLKFTVNDKHKLQCRAIGDVTPRVPKLSKVIRGESVPDSEVVASKRRRSWKPEEKSGQSTSDMSFTSKISLLNDWEFGTKERPTVGHKRSSSVAIDISPPQNGVKKRKIEPMKALISKTNAGKVYAGSWWKQRQTVYDESWMAKQREGFTKWINYVLLNERLSDCDAQGKHEEQDVRNRFDFSSLRVLTQKRMESKWMQAAVELYQSPSMEDILFNLQDEIGNKGLEFRSDRPVYADVGLQEELINLLNNYHPVWLCLGLYAVLGCQIMKEEKCSLRALFKVTTISLHDAQKNSYNERKMPQILRRIIVKHLIKDSHVAQNYRLVQHLMTPIDGSTADRHDGGNVFINEKKNINGREYFDALTQSFMLKFFMLVMFLDRAIERKNDTFMQFPCLFRIAPKTKKSAFAQAQDVHDRSQDDVVWVKNSQVFLTEFCRLFLANEGRIDKHLKLLGYTLKYEQTSLDEIDLEVTNLYTDLCDGVRLAKLIEALTTRSLSFDKKSGDGRIIRSLSTFLRVPALSLLQKTHNVEICLHYLQDKCGTSIFDTLYSSDSKMDEKLKINGRVRVSASGFAGLQSRVNEQMVKSLAKEIVSGHREKILALLWLLISCFQLQSLVDASTMRREIENVVKRMSFRAKNFFDSQQQIAPLAHTNEHECYTLLLEWCRAVCANYDVEICDFSGSFADGKALCYLLHYYHPMLLSKTDVLPTTSDVRDEKSKDMNEKSLLMNEQRHFAIVNDRIKQLGEVPVLMPQQYNSRNPPDDKMVVTFVCYLQSRLMDSYGEIHAASRLKRWWRSPFIRLRLFRQKSRSARVVQRFWFTSSQKRLAIRQCRKLLRAAYTVKRSVQTFALRKRFIRLRKYVIAIQRAFRLRQHLRDNVIMQEAASVIQIYWQKHFEWTRGKTRILLEVRQQKVAQEKMKLSCFVIEKNWLQYLSKEAARLYRQQLIADRQAAVSIFQAAWRHRKCRFVARKQRQEMWRQLHFAARIFQRAWAFRKIREKMKRRVALQRYEQMLRDKEFQVKRVELKQKVETRAATIVQKVFRGFLLNKREIAATKMACVFRGVKQRQLFHRQKQAIKRIQRNVRVWRRANQLNALKQLYNKFLTYQQMKIQEAQKRSLRLQALKFKVEMRASCRIKTFFRRSRHRKQTCAATIIQASFRGWAARTWYRTLCHCTCLIQRNVRVWRRQNQLRALLLFQKMLLSYRRQQREEEEFLMNLRQDRLRRLRNIVLHRSAFRIQSVYRVYAHRKRMLAAKILQTAFRGFIVRLRYISTYSNLIRIQRAAHAWVARIKFQQRLRMHRAVVRIQKRIRGRNSRRYQFDFYTLKTQLQKLRIHVSCWQIEFWYEKCIRKYRRKRMLVMRAHWTRLSYCLLFKRRTEVNRIETCWRSYRLRKILNDRVEYKYHRNIAAQHMQVWWLELCCKWAERKRRIDEKHQQKIKEIAITMGRTRAERKIALWLREKVVAPHRAHYNFIKAVRRVQASWRGAMVRLYKCTEEITQQRKKLCTMKLVEQEADASTNLSSKSLERLRVEVRDESNAQTKPPQTLGTRLDLALHMLIYGERLQDMLFASYTIEVCTRYSRECCRTCVQLRISSTIFGAIRGLNRSRPHVELLHQLLLVLRNLTMYRRSADKKKKEPLMDTKDAKKRLDVDLRALDTLVDLLHIHRDMHHVFVLSAKVIMYYLERLRPFVSTHEDVNESWSGAEKRLTGLRELLMRKLALYNATASFRRANRISDKSAANNLMRKVDPKTAVSIMEQIMRLVVR